MKFTIIFSIVCIGVGGSFAKPTARTYCFAAMENNFSDPLIDSLAKYFDVVITHDAQRNYNWMFRDSNETTWRRDEPIIFMKMRGLTNSKKGL